MRWCRTGNEMVWDGGSEPRVVPTRRTLLGVALVRAPVWPCGGGGRLHGEERRKASSVLPPTRAVALVRKPTRKKARFNCHAYFISVLEARKSKGSSKPQ